MADFVKKPLGNSLNTLAVQRANEAVSASGKALPCTVAKVVGPGIVTVNFEVNASPYTLPQVTVPVGMPPYITYPIQVGDKGVVFPADAKLGGLTGLGAGTPDLTQPGNLSALTFFWLGTTGQTTADPTSLILYQNISIRPNALGFFETPVQSKQTVTGHLTAITDANAKAVITSIIDALANYGLINIGTT